MLNAPLGAALRVGVFFVFIFISKPYAVISNNSRSLSG